ncbi:HAD-IIIA family hydrolase [Catenuloplanes sp. NPDC051500]|uniref:HAD-IIIA family hydrolase n=1 Tax=Catenuloplanes sp. NPDC051500 TaxID=3363959 RepID=UPI0037A8D687
MTPRDGGPPTAVILAGGRGTRLREISADLPKPLVPILGRPVLEYQIESLRRSGVTEVVLVVGHLGELIRDHFGDGARFGVRIGYFTETTPLGTAGCFAELRHRLPERFLVVYGDVMLDVDVARLARFHDGHRGAISMFVHPNDHPADSDVVDVDDGDVVRGLLRKNEPRADWYRNLVNAGILLCERRVFDGLTAGRAADLERDVVLPAIGGGAVRAYRSSEYVKDMGTPERYRQVTEHVRRGVVAARCLRVKRKAVFLDRDGTLNQHVGLVSTPEQLHVVDEAFDALAALNDSAYLAIVITNQPVVARNLCTLDGLRRIHRKLETVLGEHHVYLDDLYFCPHHPDRGYPEENAEYKIVCGCRKPATGLIHRAADDHNIDLTASYLVGDTTVDVQTGRTAGLRTILLDTGEGGADGRYNVVPDHRAAGLRAATEIILGERPRVRGVSR